MLHFFFFQGQFSLTFLPAILIGAVAVRWVGLEGMDFFLATLLIVGLRAMAFLGIDLGYLLGIAACFTG